MAMTYSILPSEIDFQDYTFDFEEYVRNEVGLDITSTAKKNGGMSLSSLSSSQNSSIVTNTPLLSSMNSVAKINDVVVWRHQHLFCPHSNSIGIVLFVKKKSATVCSCGRGIGQL